MGRNAPYVYLYILNNAASTNMTMISPIKKGPNIPTRIPSINNGKNTINKKCLYFKIKKSAIIKIMNSMINSS